MPFMPVYLIVFLPLVWVKIPLCNILILLIIKNFLDRTQYLLQFVKRSMSEATLERLSGILGSLSTILRMEESEGTEMRIFAVTKDSISVHKLACVCSTMIGWEVPTFTSFVFVTIYFLYDGSQVYILSVSESLI